MCANFVGIQETIQWSTIANRELHFAATIKSDILCLALLVCMESLSLLMLSVVMVYGYKCLFTSVIRLL